MENTTTTEPIGEAVRTAILETLGSLRAASIQSGIPYTTLYRRLEDGTQFSVSELRRLATATGRNPSDFTEAGK